MKKIALLFVFLVCSISALGQGVNLKGRTLVGSVPRPTYTVNESGTVVVTVWVDNYGNVTKAQAGAEGTTTKSKELWTAARNAAMKAHFDQKADAPALQQGTITFVFKLAGNNQVSITNDNPEYEEELVDETALRFLDIPIDGSKKYMVAHLKNKGFKDVLGEYLEGQFNGDPVKVFVHTYHEKVDRIIVEFERIPEMGIREQYNYLLALLYDAKYKPLQLYSPIPEDDDHYYDNPSYRAHFDYDLIEDERIGDVCLAIIDRGGYHVTLYYDNLNNRPKGEDL